MTISYCSMTGSLLDFAFTAFCGDVGKCGLSLTMLNVLVVAKVVQILYYSGAKLVKFHDFCPILHVP